jgi:hypothetical protein
MTLLNVNTTIRPAFTNSRRENENVIQGYNPYEAVRDDGTLRSSYFEDDYSLYVQYGVADAPRPAEFYYGDESFTVEEWLLVLS